MSAPPPRSLFLAALAAIAVAIVVRLNDLGALSFYYDELYATRIHGLSLRNVAGVVARSAFYDQHPPLYYLFALAWTSVTGLSELGVRALSAAFGVALLPVVYLLGRELADKRTAVWAMAVTALFPLHVYYSREARMYAQLSFFAALSVWLLVRVAREPRARWALPSWVLAATAASLTHYFGAVHVFALFVLIAARGRRGAVALPAWLGVFGVPFVAFVPFAVFARYQAGHFDSSYLGFSAQAYGEVAAWLSATHQSLPGALVLGLPFVALCSVGARASLAEAPTGVERAPELSPRTRAAALIVGLAALVAAGALFAVRARFADQIAALGAERGEVAAIAALQGRTAVLAAISCGLAAALVAALIYTSDRAAAAVSARISSPHEDAPRRDPIASLALVALAVCGVPLALSLAAGLAGKPLVLVRNFIIAVPFLALLVARGIVALPGGQRIVAAGAVGILSLFIVSRFGALSGVERDGDSVRPWLVHTYHDWRAVSALTARAPEVPWVLVHHYATDAAIHYRGMHPIVRVRGERGALDVSQVRVEEGVDLSAREGEALHPEMMPRLFVVTLDAGLHREGGVSRRILDSARANHECSIVGVVTGGATVFDCEALEAVAAR